MRKANNSLKIVGHTFRANLQSLFTASVKEQHRINAHEV